MLRLVQYRSQNELFENGLMENFTFLVPNPLVADDLRSLLAEHAIFSSQTVTAAKYLRDHISDFAQEKSFLDKKSIKLLLAELWIEYFKGFSYSEFTKIFNLLTDIRGHTLDLNVIDAVLEDKPEHMRKAVLVFCEYLSQRNVLDEHGAYFYLSNSHEHLESTLKERVVVWGFKHLSGSQVDYFVSLSKFCDVSFYLPSYIFKNAHPNEWISWLESSANERQELKSESEAAIESYYFHKSRMSEAVSFLSEKKSFDYYVLASKSPRSDEYMEISGEEVFYKSEATIFDDVAPPYLKRLKESLELKLSDGLNSDALLEIIGAEMKINVESNDLKRFRLLRVQQLLKEAVSKWLELCVAEEKLSHSHFDVFSDYVIESLPRNYLLTAVDHKSKQILNLENMSMANGDVLLCIRKEAQSFSSSEKVLPIEVEKELSKVSPIRSISLENRFVMGMLLELSCSTRLTVLYENGLIEENKYWREFFLLFDQNGQGLQESEGKNYEGIDSYGRYIEKKLSSQRLQSYIDCPRKFWSKYIRSFSSNLLLEQEISLLELGRLQHQLIQNYCEQHQFFESELFNSFIEKSWNTFLVEKNRKLKLLNEIHARHEITALVKNGCQALLELCKLLDLKEYDFERKIQYQESDIENIGYVDFLSDSNENLFFVDFKRSSSSVPSFKSLEQFEVVQLSYYLDALLKGKKPKHVTCGYIDLSSPESSMFLSTNVEHVDLIKENGLGKASELELFSLCEQFRTFKEKLVEDIYSDREFKAEARDISICRFCSLSNVCEGSLSANS